MNGGGEMSKRSTCGLYQVLFFLSTLSCIPLS